jgi:hypothetical protein
VEAIMSASQLTLNDEERQFLMDLLTHELKEKRIEERRTGFNTYREIVTHQEEVIESLLNKLGHGATV